MSLAFFSSYMSTTPSVAAVGEGDNDGLRDTDGDTDGLIEGDKDTDGEIEGDNETLGLTDGDSETDGDNDTDGEIDGEILLPATPISSAIPPISLVALHVAVTVVSFSELYSTKLSIFVLTGVDSELNPDPTVQGSVPLPAPFAKKPIVAF